MPPDTPAENCVYCARHLNELEQHFGDICFDVPCIEKRPEIDWGEKRSELAKHLEIQSPESFPVVLVPHQERNPAPLPDERIASFRNHLETVVRNALDPDFEYDDLTLLAQNLTPESIGFPPGLTSWMGRICTACRGQCCEAGGDTAFLDVPTLKRFAARHQEMSADRIVDSYMSKLPDRNLEGACVYQSETGCALPREDRAAICNSYECAGLRTARRNWERSGTEQAFVLEEDEEIEDKGKRLMGASFVWLDELKRL